MSTTMIAWTTLPFAAFVAFAVFVLMAESNAVNLTDGLDGLAIGPGDHLFVHVHVPVVRGRDDAAKLQHRRVLGMPHVPGAGELAGVLRRDGRRRASASCGSTRIPAQVFMGDVGALALGGAIGFVALATKTELALPDHRRPVRRRGGQRHHPGRLLQEDQEAHLPDGAHPPPLREAGWPESQNSGAVFGSCRSLARF
jgi:hypothetical protein